MNQAWAAAWVAKSPQFITYRFSSGAVAGDAVMVGAGASEVVEGGAVVGGAVGAVGRLWLSALCCLCRCLKAARKHRLNRRFLRLVNAQFPPAFTATQLATYSHRYPTAGGSHSAGSRSPLERFEDADTAISVSGDASSFANASRREELQLLAPESHASASGTRWSISNDRGSVVVVPSKAESHRPLVGRQPSLVSTGSSDSAARTSYRVLQLSPSTSDQ